MKTGTNAFSIIISAGRCIESDTAATLGIVRSARSGLRTTLAGLHATVFVTKTSQGFGGILLAPSTPMHTIAMLNIGTGRVK
jgi:hypothetical protein